MNQSYVPSLLDLQVFELLAVAPPGDLFHAVRFFNHINSFSSSERKQFKSTGKTLESFGCSASAASKPAAKKNVFCNIHHFKNSIFYKFYYL